MENVRVHAEDVSLSAPVLIEGLPGVGLVGKLAADHLVEELDMTYYASCQCEGLPDVAVYDQGSHEVTPPVRLYADPSEDLLVLQSDVPVSPTVATDFATDLVDWMADADVTPVFLSGIAEEKDGTPDMYGVATGDATSLLSEADVGPPNEKGLVSGPTGALLAAARDRPLDALGLIVQSNPQFPDPEAARILLTKGVEPITGVGVDTGKLTDQAEQIADARQELAQRMQQAQDSSSKAEPLGMYQ